MRTFALMIVMLFGVAFAAAADDGCDCDKKENVKVEKVEVQTVVVECPEKKEAPARRRPENQFRIGFIGTSELAAQASVWDYFPAAFANSDVFPGLYWEVRFKHFGFGMTYLGRFIQQDTGLPTAGRTWFIDVIGTLDIRYHFLADSFLDPFVEGGIGAAGRVSMTHETYDCVLDMLSASIFARGGAGLGLNFKHFHIGTKILYRFFQDAIPCVDLPSYDVSQFELSLFAGWSIF
ncbi:MAG: hypothetical protein JXD23_13380 [Spirochaetales bacterium]|nr:hypothetical protein [Spirochaetales bacterium]